MKAINPATEQCIASYEEHSLSDVDRLLGRAQEAFLAWRKTSFAERSALLNRVAGVLRDGSRMFAELMTREMGKPISGALSEVEKCAVTCEHYAQQAERYLSEVQVESDASSSYVRYDPIGAVLAVMPWNFPFWQLFRFAAPALMAGNVGVLKHAANVPGCALALERIFREAGYPPGAFTTLMIGSDLLPKVIEHPVIRAVTLTGSDRAGRAVASSAGRVLKKTVLELGGSDPFIVLADNDLEKVAEIASQARCINSGQSCIAAKRFIVEAPAVEAFTRVMVDRMSQLKLGDPMDPSTQIGPMARRDLADSLHDQVTRSLAAGATCLLGGRKPDRKGFYYEPTVLGDCKPGVPAFDEETFGPVAAIVSARDADEAVALANQSPFGLGASIWCRDARRAEAYAPQIEAGCVFVNGIVKSDPRLPFGGIKDSGYGRELSKEGIVEFTNVKTVWIR